MYEWMNKQAQWTQWMNEWMNAGPKEMMNEWVYKLNWLMKKKMNERINEMSKWTDGRIKTSWWMDQQTNSWMCEWMCKLKKKWAWLNEEINEWINEWTH